MHPTKVHLTILTNKKTLLSPHNLKTPLFETIEEHVILHRSKGCMISI